MIDDKLREIKVKCYDGAFYLNDSTLSDENIAQIKQVFADEGYVKLDKDVYLGKSVEEMAESLHNGTIIEIYGNKIMLGSQWYEKFEKEIEKTNVTTDFVKEMGLKPHETAIIYTVTKLVEAAKRAAGITDDK